MLLARNKNEGNIYAIKVLQKQAIMKRNEVKHIMSERNVLLKNVKHPFLVGLHYSFQTADKLYFVLDYVNGGEVSILQFALIDLCQLLCYCMNTCVLSSYFLLGVLMQFIKVRTYKCHPLINLGLLKRSYMSIRKINLRRFMLGMSWHLSKRSPPKSCCIE